MYRKYCHRVAQAYLNQKKLDAEAKQLQTSATNFAKQTQSWLHLVESFSSALKEIGDVENWARSIEGDMRTIATALEYSYKGIYINFSTKFKNTDVYKHKLYLWYNFRHTRKPSVHFCLDNTHKNHSCCTFVINSFSKQDSNVNYLTCNNHS